MMRMMTSVALHWWLELLLTFIAIEGNVNGQLDESERLLVYEERGYTWPPQEHEYTPNTPGWRKLFERRFRQLDEVDGDNNSYNGYMSAIHSALLSPNFTESG